MANKIPLTGSHIRYLLAIKRIYKDTGVRSVDIAKELKITKVSVHKMMNIFIDLYYIHKERGGLVYFTERGMKKAIEFEYYHKLLKDKLFLDITVDETADNAICAFISELWTLLWMKQRTMLFVLLFPNYLKTVLRLLPERRLICWIILL